MPSVGTHKIQDLDPIVAAKLTNQPGGVINGEGSVTGWANVAKAFNFLATGDLDRCFGHGSPKIRSFFSAFQERGQRGTPVIDRWMVGAMTGIAPVGKAKSKESVARVKEIQNAFTTSPRKKGGYLNDLPRWGTYQFFSSAITEATKRHNAAHPDKAMTVHDAQAVIWYAAMGTEEVK